MACEGKCDGGCSGVQHNNELLRDNDNGSYIHLKGEDEIEHARRIVGQGEFPDQFLPKGGTLQEALEAMNKGKDTTNPKDLIGDTKPDLSLVPPAAVIYMALAMGDGAKKYGPYNWREKKVRCRVYLAACMRHIQQFLDGEECAEDSGRPHLAHALACLGIIADAKETGNLVDDRPLPGAASTLIKLHTVTKR